MDGMSSHYPFVRSSNFSHFPINPSPSISTNLLHHLFRQKNEMINPDFYLHHQQSSSLDESNRYTPSPNFAHSPSKTKILLKFKEKIFFSSTKSYFFKY
jgi:hypothetical protein